MSKFARFIRCCEVCVARPPGASLIAFGHAFQESLPPLRGARSCVFRVRRHAFVRRRGGNPDIGRRLRCRPSRFRELLRGAVRFVRLSSAPFRHRVRFVTHSCLRGRSAFRCLAAGKCRSVLLRPCCCRFGEIHRMAFVRLRFRGASAAHAFTARTRSLLQWLGSFVGQAAFLVVPSKGLAVLVSVVAVLVCLIDAMVPAAPLFSPPLGKEDGKSRVDASREERSSCAEAGREEGFFSSLNLTPREREVCSLWVRGHTAAHIERRLCVSKSTVKTHVSHIYEKAGVSSREELIAAFEEFAPSRSR